MPLAKTKKPDACSNASGFLSFPAEEAYFSSVVSFFSTDVPPGVIVVLVSVFFSVDVSGVTMVVLFSAGGLTVVSLCSQEKHNEATMVANR